MKLTLAYLDQRLDAEARMLVKGSQFRDCIEWSQALNARVLDSAERIARRVDWTADGITPTAGNARVLSRLEQLVLDYLSEMWIGPQAPSTDVTPAMQQSNSGLRAIAEEAAEEWRQHRTSWVPDAVTSIIYGALSRDEDRAAALQLARAIKTHRADLRAAEATREHRQNLAAAREDARIRSQRAAAEQALREADERRRSERAERERRAAEAEQLLRRAETERQRAQAEAQEERRRVAVEAEKTRLKEERRRRWLRRPAPAPGPQPYGISHEGAERLCAEWMRHLGVLDAEATRYTGDGGIDIHSTEYVAQVKNYAGSIAVGDVRALFGVAAADDKKALIFTSGSFTADGLAFAERTGMALLRYDAIEGSLAGINRLGAACIEFSIPEAFSQQARQPDAGAV